MRQEILNANYYIDKNCSRTQLDIRVSGNPFTSFACNPLFVWRRKEHRTGCESVYYAAIPKNRLAKRFERCRAYHWRL
jgi:hypothetical protein